ncbi:twin-arginine translocase subunit TatC [Candidatus Shikimatogenerans silvanidophilus]|uniref:twin-arginine translocase subunit TatC n=1 Tax=Candidatus Shikimatogenerans silvanidophilus TaxID=2782547 RepID=UPI001BA7EF7C|nr:twin-arginine translocase subunit TatC [Candidatus Shikimatogenerans silvanidophilus]
MNTYNTESLKLYYNKNNQSFLSHLQNFREHLIRCFLFFLINIIFLLLIKKKIIFDYIIFFHFKKNLLLCNENNFLKEKSFFLLEDKILLQNRDFFGQINTYFLVIFYLGLILSFPYCIYEIWKFIKPALKNNEKITIKNIFILSFILFFIGSFFGYFLLFPITINFINNFSISKFIFNIFDLYNYIYSMFYCTIMMGIIFLLPIFIIVLLKLEIISHYILRKYKLYFLFIIFVIISAITPGDILITLISIFPILFLYEIILFFYFYDIKNNIKKILNK